MSQGLASIGLSVVVDTAEMNYVTEISDIGESPSALDVTCLRDDVRKTTPGVQDKKAFEISYLFHNADADSDFRRLRSMDGRIVLVAITFPDGTIFMTTSSVITYVTGGKTDELLNAKLVLFPQDDWALEQHPYEIPDSLKDSSGDVILDGSGEPIIGRLVL